MEMQDKQDLEKTKKIIFELCEANNYVIDFQNPDNYNNINQVVNRILNLITALGGSYEDEIIRSVISSMIEKNILETMPYRERHKGEL